MNQELISIQEAYLYLLSIDDISESYVVRKVTNKEGTRIMMSAEVAIRRAKELAGPKTKLTMDHVRAAIKELSAVHAEQNK